MKGHLVDGRADIFSLGVVFYELLTASRPFWVTDREKILERIRRWSPVRHGNWTTSIPKELGADMPEGPVQTGQDRYTTALDMAEDLRHFLAQTAEAGSRLTLRRKWKSRRLPGADSPARRIGFGRTPRSSPRGCGPSMPRTPISFWNFSPAPGPDGLPESIRFWKYRIEETNCRQDFSSGPDLRAIGLRQVVAGEGRTVAPLGRTCDFHLRGGHCRRHRGPSAPGIAKAMSRFAGESRPRREHRRPSPRTGIPAGKKVLVVIDQFEQWLHAKRDQKASPLVEALRQCDGGRVQCIVMVRDDFWMAVSRFMQELEIDFVEGQNSCAG